MMRRSRSSSSDRKSLAPLRVRNDDNNEQSSSTNGRSSMRKSSLNFGNPRSLSGNRMSVGGQSSVGSRSSVSNLPRPSIGNNRRISSNILRPNQFQTKRLSRGSGIGVRNNGVPKDPRPVSDKAYQHKCIKNLFQFLSDKGYPHNITTKILQSPTNKDFFRIFEFMYSLIVPDYKNSSRPEEDIPRIFKTLGYPFMISKSAMFAVGSPHMWPTILAALHFLMELIEYGCSMHDQSNFILFPPDDESFDAVSEGQILHNYFMATYKKFMEGNDDYPEEDEAVRNAFTNNFAGSSGGMEALLEEKKTLEMELEYLGQDKDKLKLEGQNLQRIKLDEDRLISYLNELAMHKGKLEKEAQEIEVKMRENEKELEEENAKYLKLQLIFEKQEFTPEELSRLKQKGRELKHQKDDFEKTIQGLDQDIWQHEMRMSKILEEVNSSVQKYNSLAQKLKLIPISAENSGGIDYELKKLTFSDEAINNYVETVKPALSHMKRQCIDSYVSKEAEKMKLLERVEEVTEKLDDLKNEISLLENKSKRADMELENKKQMFQKEKEEVQLRIEELENEKIMWNSGAMNSDQDFEKEKKEIAKRYEMEHEKRRKTLLEYKDFFSEALGVFMDHMSSVKATLVDSKKIPEDLLKKTKEQAKRLGIE